MLRSEWDRNHSATGHTGTVGHETLRVITLVSSPPSVCEKSVTRWLTSDTGSRATT